MYEIQKIVSMGSSIFESATVMVLLATIAVIIRFVSKTLTKAGFSSDDYWIFLSLAAFWTYFGSLCWAIFKEGGGLDMHNLREADLRKTSLYFKALFVCSIFYTAISATTKLSILVYYRRIFATQVFDRRTQIFNHTALVLILVTALAWLVQELGILLECFPLRSAWNPSVKGRCINLNIFLLVLGLVDLLLDISILCLPMLMIPRLQLSLRQRMSLSMIFLLGGFVCITAIIRLKKTYSPGQDQFNLNGIPWSNIHLGTAIICACLPTYRAILSKCAHGFAKLQLPYRSRFSSKQELDHSTNSLSTTDGSKIQKPRSYQDDQKNILGAVSGITHGEDSANNGYYSSSSATQDAIDDLGDLENHLTNVGRAQ